MSFTAQLVIHCDCFSVDKFNSKYQYKTYFAYYLFFCNDDRDQILWVIGVCFFMLFFLTVKCQCKFYSKLNFPKTGVW